MISQFDGPLSFLLLLDGYEENEVGSSDGAPGINYMVNNERR